MNPLIKLAIIPSLIPLAAIKPPIIKEGVEINFDQMGPYEKYQNPCPSFTYEMTGNYLNGCNCIITFMFGDSVVPNRRSIQNTFTANTYGERKSFTITIPTNICLGDDGMSITCTSYNNDSGVRSTLLSFTILPLTKETINPFQLSNKKYTGRKIVGKKSNNIFIATGENYTFTSFVDYFLTDTYFSLSLDQFIFTRSISENAIPYKEAYLCINGGSKYFPGLSYQDDVTKIPINLTQKSSKISIKFQNTMYVDPKLLIMSLTPKEGYVATNHFFFPVNHAKDLEGITFTFELIEVGLSRVNIVWDASYLAVNGLLGSCQNSEYCVHGEPSK